MKLAVLVILIGSWMGIAEAQSRYTALKETALVAAAETVTVQQVAAPSARNVNFETLVLYCSVACDVTLTLNGTAATATAFATTPLGLFGPSSSLAYASSNSSGGASIGKYSLSAGATIAIDLSKITIPPSTRGNLTAATSSITGTARIAFIWKEE